MAVRVVQFSNGEYKIRSIFAKESTYRKEIIEFRELVWWGAVKNWTVIKLSKNYYLNDLNFHDSLFHASRDNFIFTNECKV